MRCAFQYALVYNLSYKFVTIARVRWSDKNPLFTYIYYTFVQAGALFVLYLNRVFVKINMKY